MKESSMKTGSTAETPNVIISIVNWNGGQRVVDFVQSLDQLDYDNFETVVVDNASADDSAARLRSMFPALKVIASDKNRGYAGGQQLAMDYALETDAELFWMVNYDLTFEPNVLQMLVDAYGHNGPALYGSLSLRQFDKGGPWTVERDFHGYKMPGIVDLQNPIIFSQQDPAKLVPTHGETIPIANLNGNSILIPLSIVRWHGFMNEAFFMYGEEWEYCFRLAREGVNSLLVLPSLVYHEFKGTTWHSRELSSLMTYYLVRNMIYITKRYADTGSYRMVLTSYWRRLFDQMKRWLRQQFVERRLRRPSIELKCYLFGITDGLRGRLGKRFSPDEYFSYES
jgi:GT2 family glycosyltransferase